MFPKKLLVEWVLTKWLLNEKRISVFTWFLITRVFCSLCGYTGELCWLFVPLAPVHGRLGREQQICGAATTIICSADGRIQQCLWPTLHWISSSADGKHAVSRISRERGTSLAEGRGAEEDWVINCNSITLFFTSFFPLCFYSRTTKS